MFNKKVFKEVISLQNRLRKLENRVEELEEHFDKLDRELHPPVMGGRK